MPFNQEKGGDAIHILSKTENDKTNGLSTLHNCIKNMTSLTMPRIIHKLRIEGSQADFLRLEINLAFFFFF